jgi:hypothetical protein
MATPTTRDGHEITALFEHVPPEYPGTWRTGRINVRLMSLEEGNLRNLTRHCSALGNLVITSVYNHHDLPKLYGYHVEYLNAYSVDLDRAEEMIKVLRKVHRGMIKLEKEWGAATTFDQFAMRALKSLGIQTVYTNRNHGYDTENIVRWRIQDLGWIVNSEIARITERATA